MDTLRKAAMIKVLLAIFTIPMVVNEESTTNTPELNIFLNLEDSGKIIYYCSHKDVNEICNSCSFWPLDNCHIACNLWEDQTSPTSAENCTIVKDGDRVCLVCKMMWDLPFVIGVAFHIFLAVVVIVLLIVIIHLVCKLKAAYRCLDLEKTPCINPGVEQTSHNYIEADPDNRDPTSPCIEGSRKPTDAKIGHKADASNPAGTSEPPSVEGNANLFIEQESVSLTNISGPSRVVDRPIYVAPKKCVTASSLYRAFNKAEGSCEIPTTTLCTEAHADFIKDNIRVDTHKDFFVKLGLCLKDYGATMYDHRNEGIREQIRHVLIEGFIGKQSNPTINRLFRALDESGNKGVKRDFKDKFQVKCSADC